MTTPRVTVPVDVVAACNGEQEHFETWAKMCRYDMSEHPLHYIFTDPKTNAARMGWKAALAYVHDAAEPLSAAPAPEGGAVEATGARAVIRNGQIVISIDVDALPLILSGSIALNAVAGTFKVTDAPTFAKEVCHALNAEKEDGTTRVHMMFDSAFNHAIDQGAEGVEEISEDEFEAEASRLQAEAASALATREEAPAEAGESAAELQDAVDQFISDAIANGSVEIDGQDAITWTRPDLVRTLVESMAGCGYAITPYGETTLASIPALERIEKSLRNGGWHEGTNALTALIAALRAQPPAREDAQPVARVDHAAPGGIEWKRGFSRLEHGAPLYTRPAPDALRVAVEALEAAKLLAMKHAPLSVAPKIIKALAALQAEQKGGA
ncbi:hypothetical protein [Brevundimonas diminuta]|jgi:hypothetical protein|uniref:hypothetical protein n=1 Tax=Brevundimonas diminuta TaxID=293 RepID=UPI003F805C7B